MQQYQTLLNNIEEDIPEDDIDILFRHLQPVELPSTFIAQLLSRLATSSHTHSHSENDASASLFSQPFMLENLDNWIEQKQRRSIC
jgi:hypothetical protein